MAMKLKELMRAVVCVIACLSMVACSSAASIYKPTQTRASQAFDKGDAVELVLRDSRRIETIYLGAAGGQVLTEAGEFEVTELAAIHGLKKKERSGWALFGLGALAAFLAAVAFGMSQLDSDKEEN